MLDALDVDAVRRWSATSLDLLAAHRDEIDALNVFPVADSDTGSNALTTMRAADAALAAMPSVETVGAAFAAMADGAARDALGNSGFLTSQILRGLAVAHSTTDGSAGHVGTTHGAAALAHGLHTGAILAREAVVTPVAGTILTVAEEGASAARSTAGTGGSLGDTVVAATRAADDALQRTTEQLADLARAGVVDAGGRVLVVLLAALTHTITGTTVPLTPARRPERDLHTVDDTAYGYEVQYRLDAPQDRLAELRTALARIGDSVAVVDVGPDAWNVHVHVDDVGAAVEAGVEVGRPRDIKVVALHVHGRAHTHDNERTGGVAVLAIAPGAGLAHLFDNAGVDGVHVVAGGADDLPAVADVVAAVHATGAAQVVLLPNASRVTGVAEAAAVRARADGIGASVVPTRSAVQGLAAVAVHDPGRRFDDDVVAMAEAAAATRYAEIAVADSQALTAVGVCQAGDVLGLIDGEVVQIGHSLLAVAFTLVDRLLAVGAELMTVLVGSAAPARTGDLLQAHVRGRAPLTDVAVYDAGQSEHPVIIGVE
ncbi:DAK2 domain-containing protein [uncultured Jatrophihabitans sp.]|uniref:DAK2 domain-containing protein n=1 Tax=uncultured Jatrophihabitans sp. TaxID=1610747 RepID=UPI0035CB3DC1